MIKFNLQFFGAKLGNIDISNIMLGDTQVDKVYLGNVLVWESGTWEYPILENDELTITQVFNAILNNGELTIE